MRPHAGSDRPGADSPFLRRAGLGSRSALLLREAHPGVSLFRRGSWLAEVAFGDLSLPLHSHPLSR